MCADNSFHTAVLDAVLPPTDASLSATVFVRSLAPVASKERQDRLVEGFERLLERDALTDIDLLVWGNSICPGGPLSDVGTGTRIVDAVREFYDLAADSDISVDPFFTRTDVTTEYREASFRRIVPPSRAVALYDGGELSAVFPCLIGETVYTPEDALAFLGRQRTRGPDRLLVDESA